jgi:hypothetical protein
MPNTLERSNGYPRLPIICRFKQFDWAITFVVKEIFSQVASSLIVLAPSLSQWPYPLSEVMDRFKIAIA